MQDDEKSDEEQNNNPNRGAEVAGRGERDDKADRNPPRSSTRASATSILPDIVRETEGLRGLFPDAALGAFGQAVQVLDRYRGDLGRTISAQIAREPIDLVSKLGISGFNVVMPESFLGAAKTFIGIGFPDAVLPATFGAKLAERHLIRMKAGLEMADMFSGAFARDLQTAISIASLIDTDTSSLARLSPSSGVGRAAVLAVDAFEAATKSVLAVDLTGPAVARIPLAGSTTAWGVRAAIRIADNDTTSTPRESLHLLAVDSAVVGPVPVLVALRTRILALPGGEHIIEKLDGGWQSVRSGGRNAGSMAAHSFQETLDHTLRALAPNEAVFEWRRLQGRPDSDLHDGKPTRPCRMAFIVRNDPSRLGTLKSFVKSLDLLGRELQGDKHGLEVPDSAQLVPLGLMLEALLEWLLL